MLKQIIAINYVVCKCTERPSMDQSVGKYLNRNFVDREIHKYLVCKHIFDTLPRQKFHFWWKIRRFRSEISPKIFKAS